MTFKTTETTIGTAVVSSGTITFAYPANTNAGSFSAHSHKLWIDKHQKLYSSPSDFTVAFGASNVTVTYLGSTTIPVGAEAKLQANVEGTDDGEAILNIEENVVKRSTATTLVTIDLGAPDTADVNGILETYNGAVGTVTLDGALTSGGVATFDVPRNIVIDSGGADTAVLTFTGTDEYGNIVVEAITLNGTTAVAGKKAFKTVTSCVSSGATIANGAFAGPGDVLGLPVFLPGSAYIVAEIEDGAAASAGTVVAGVSTAATATSGDVRGTYDADSAADGSTVFQLIVALPDPEYKGVAQYAG